jgi:large subunit ribosomal protein L24
MQQTKRVKNPGKQRKRLFNAPAHIRHKLMAAPLSSELTASRGAKTLPVRKGDTVRIERGDNKGFEGKVSRIDSKHYRIFLEGLTREKVDGTNIFISIHPSKVQIRNLNLDDKRRKDILGRKAQIEKPEREEKAKAKPTKKAGKIEEEKIGEQAPLEEEAMPEVVEEQAPAEEVEKKVAEKAPTAKKVVAKKAETPVEEETAPAKKAAKPKTAAKKTAASKEAPVKETASKSRAKQKAEEGDE